jgi:hypothetical protein
MKFCRGVAYGADVDEWRAANPDKVAELHRRWREAVEEKKASRAALFDVLRGLITEESRLVRPSPFWHYYYPSAERGGSYAKYEVEMLAEEVPNPEDRLRVIEALGRWRCALDVAFECGEALRVVGVVPSAE